MGRVKIVRRQRLGGVRHDPSGIRGYLGPSRLAWTGGRVSCIPASLAARVKSVEMSRQQPLIVVADTGRSDTVEIRISGVRRLSPQSTSAAKGRADKGNR
jgi:hypothetical protein